MKVYDDICLTSFQFWSGGKDRAMMLTYDEIEEFESVLEELYPDGVDATTINDIFWFDFGFVCESIGLQYDEEEDKIIRN